MTVPNPEHLFEQAEQLVSSLASRRPRQVDLRRAVSNAYYAVFHATLTAAADNAVGPGARASAPYRLVYRSVRHRTLRELCKEILKTTPSAKYRQYIPQGGFGANIRSFAEAMVDLQERREAADYDPLEIFNRSAARFAINQGRSALHRFEAASKSDRDAFLSLLLFPLRS